MPSRVGELYMPLWAMQVPEVQKYSKATFITKFAKEHREFNDKNMA